MSSRLFCYGPDPSVLMFSIDEKPLIEKYSRYEHSQPLDAPVQLPEPDELEGDFNELKKWQADAILSEVV